MPEALHPTLAAVRSAISRAVILPVAITVSIDMSDMIWILKAEVDSKIAKAEKLRIFLFRKTVY
jgi:hypothetical protein